MSTNTQSNNTIKGDFHYFDVITNVLKHHSKGEIQVPESSTSDLTDLDEAQKHLVELELIKPEDMLLHRHWLD